MRGRHLVGGVAIALLALSPAAALGTNGDGASLSGEVYLDLDGDGARDAGEPGRGDVQLTLRSDAAILDATTSTADGSWVFNNVPAGELTLVVEPSDDHTVTGSTIEGLDTDSGEATLDVAGDAELGAIGLGSPLTTGPDVAATVAFDEDASTEDASIWRLTALNLGTEPATGPIDLRAVLSAGHEVAGADGDGWTCETSAAIVLCSADTDLAAGTLLPSLTLTTTSTGDVGTMVEVTGTVRLVGTFDGAPLNDEAVASAMLGAEDITEDLDGDGTSDITNAGASVTGLLVAALLALVLGAAVVTTTHRTSRP